MEYKASGPAQRSLDWWTVFVSQLSLILQSTPSTGPHFLKVRKESLLKTSKKITHCGQGFCNSLSNPAVCLQLCTLTPSSQQLAIQAQI